MTTPTPPPVLIRCDRPDCRCARDDLESARLRKLLETLRRSVSSVERCADEIIAIEERRERAA